MKKACYLSLLIKLKWYKTATFLHKQSIKRISLSLTLNGDVHNKDGKVTGFMNYSVLFVVSFFMSLCLFLLQPQISSAEYNG